MKANYHTHTWRCGHAVGTEREYVEKAIQEGFEILGFSDHVPQPYPKNYKSPIRMSIEQIPDYTRTLLELREEYRDRIQILIGYEVEYSRRFFQGTLDAIRSSELDYIILGQHFVPNEVDGFYVGSMTSDEKHLADYVDLTIEAMETGLFTYMAHPDLINFWGSDDVYVRHMTRLIEAANALGMPMEINMYGFYDGRNYPNDTFWQLASDMKAKTVIGCDAHFERLVSQPENVPGLMAFLQKHSLQVGDNILPLVDPK